MGEIEETVWGLKVLGGNYDVRLRLDAVGIRCERLAEDD